MRRSGDMRTAATAAFLAAVSLSTAARAQPAPTPETTPAPEPAPAAVEPVAPAPEPERRESRPPPDPPAASVEAEASGPNRPDGMSIGIGIGYSIPAQVLEPNLASVRFRFPSGLTVEPTVVLDTARTTVKVGPAETEASEATFAANLRLPVAGRGKIDLVLIGSAGLSYQKQSPDGADNDTSTTTLALAWGLGLDYWPKQSWCLSASATNPLFSLQRTRQEMVPQDQRTTTLQLGAIFDPGVFVMLHMFF